MNVTDSSLERINSHWAIQAIGDEQIKKASTLTNHLLVEKSVGKQIQFNYTFSQTDYELLEKVSMAYEIAAIEGLNDFLNPTSDDKKLREQCASGAYRAFEIRRLFELPTSNEQRILHVLHLSSLAYCGDRWTDLRRWYKENDEILQILSVENTSWDSRLLNRIFECWVRLFRKKQWDDLNQIQ